VNSVGCPECRSKYRGKLQDVLRDRLGELCTDCVERYEKNPLRILDCKSEVCRELTEGVPLMMDNLCGQCGDHFEAVQRGLEVLGEKFVVNPRLVRGLDYYTKTAFEIISPALGAQSSIGGGGRYDNLMAEIGGPDTPGIGFAIGIERVLLALEAAGVDVPVRNMVDVFVATAGVSGDAALKLVMELRAGGVGAEKDYMGRSLKAQLKFADKKGARFLVILGEEEMGEGMASVRNMANGEQENVELVKLVGHLVGLVKEGM
jgi:histidyl-tRNA synthetase